MLCMVFSKQKTIRRNIDKKVKKLFDKGKKKEAKEFLDFFEKGGLQDSKFFWNMASYKWDKRISKEIREFIKKELSDLRGMNLSLGSGCYPYIKNSVLVDFSEEMLKKVGGGKKVNLDLNKGKLPFSDSSFDSVTMVFIVDYLKNLDKLFKEVKRVLNKDGKLVVVNSKKPIDEFYRKQEVKHHDEESLKEILRDFKVNIKEKSIGKRTLVFAECRI